MKLGQHAGPAALKRWLENLSAKDGVSGPADLAEEAGGGTIQLGSRDLELEDVTVPGDAERDAATRQERRLPVPGARRPEAAPVPAPTATPVPSPVARVGRWLRRTTLAALVLATVLGAGAYFARPYLPARLVEPVKTWLRALPPPLGSGAAAKPAGTP